MICEEDGEHTAASKTMRRGVSDTGFFMVVSNWTDVVKANSSEKATNVPQEKVGKQRATRVYMVLISDF
jgi:hypothetical protein